MKKILLSLFLLLILLSGCAPKEITPVVVFAAGSLIQPFNELEKAFEAQYPHIDVQPEYHGSIQVVRHITEIGDDIDVAASADHALIPLLMYDKLVPETGVPYADWYLQFASNEVVLAYTPESAYADEINADNWYEVLQQPDVRIGLSDPRFDALGYRVLMILKLAELHYDSPGIFRAVINDRFLTPISAYWEDGLTEISVPELIDPRPERGMYMRGSSIQVVALMEAGEVDYSFQYKSVALQNGFSMVGLPDELSLGSAAHAEDYQNVIVKIDFRRFASVEPVFQGERISYGITIPTNAPHSEEAQLFVEFLLSEEGRAIMEAYHHPMFDPVLANQPENLPESMQGLTGPQ